VRVTDQGIDQFGAGGLLVPGDRRFPRPVVMTGAPRSDHLGRAGHQPGHPADRGDQLDDRVLGGHRVIQDRGIQCPAGEGVLVEGAGLLVLAADQGGQHVPALVRDSHDRGGHVADEGHQHQHHESDPVGDRLSDHRDVLPVPHAPASSRSATFRAEILARVTRSIVEARP
jgi:hypothetical protein